MYMVGCYLLETPMLPSYVVGEGRAGNQGLGGRCTQLAHQENTQLAHQEKSFQLEDYRRRTPLPGNDNEGRFLPSINSGGHERAEIVCISGSHSPHHLLFLLLVICPSHYQGK